MKDKKEQAHEHITTVDGRRNKYTIRRKKGAHRKNIVLLRSSWMY